MITLKDVKEEYDEMYSRYNLMGKIELKCWLNHSKSRVLNNHNPFSFDTYTNSMNRAAYFDMVNLDIINVDDLGGKAYILNFLHNQGAFIS